MLTKAEADAVEARIRALEAHTGVEVVTTIVGRADAYTELPWMAAAFGAAFTAFAIALVDLRHPEWPTAFHGLSLAVAILGIGVICGLLAHFVPVIARPFLRPRRAQAEVHQFAAAHFLERELFATPHRLGLLILVSLFERRVVILPDRGVRDHATGDDWDDVIAQMTPALREGRLADALRDGLDATEALLTRKGVGTPHTGANVLPDRPTQVAGP
jgi:putative membrane protein